MWGLVLLITLPAQSSQRMSKRLSAEIESPARRCTPGHPCAPCREASFNYAYRNLRQPRKAAGMSLRVLNLVFPGIVVMLVRIFEYALPSEGDERGWLPGSHHPWEPRKTGFHELRVQDGVGVLTSEVY